MDFLYFFKSTIQVDVHSRLDLTIRNYSFAHVDAEVKYSCCFRLTLFYGDPAAAKRKVSWELLRKLRTVSKLPWMVIGDFNEVVGDNEVLGGRPRQLWKMSNFREVLEDCGLSDLGFKGYPFTFTNGRVGEDEYRARLDREVIDLDWRRSFPKAGVTQFHLHASDHQLLMLDMEGSECKRKKKLFRFEAMWMDHPSFGNLMGEFWNDRMDVWEDWMNCLKACRRTLSSWNSSTFGNVQRKIKDLKN
ncbi:hypothetical protein QQ045_029247 [Rhodiola kirilowii]